VKSFWKSIISSASAIASPSKWFSHDSRPVPSSAPDLSRLLLTPEEAARLDAHGRTDAAVLVPMYGWPDRPGLVFTERRSDLRRHAGEISFPGGRQDEPDEDLRSTALREAQEEIGLDPAQVELAGALPPIGTYVTSYKVHPFVGLIPEGLPLRPNPAEVETVLTFELEKLRSAYAMRRLVRLGVPLRTPTFEVDGHLIWGATGRILRDLLERLPA
jgi:8-oxo-dGTP pyrophosphatase MutT (NUDIX family)